MCYNNTIMTKEKDLQDKIEQKLSDLYLKPLKENPELFIGIELEFPIVNLLGDKTDVEVAKNLFDHLAQQGYAIAQRDEEGRFVELVAEPSGDHLLFECSYNILEIAFAKARTLQEVEERLNGHLSLIQPYLRQYGHEIQGWGIHPQWEANDNRPVKLPRYRMLADYLALGQEHPACHNFVDYGGFICSSQVQFDVSRTNYYRVLNAFNQIEPAKAYLFSNSTFDGADWDTQISRDIFWEASMHGVIPQNIGCYPQDFTGDADYLTYLSQSGLFTANREGAIYYFPPRSLSDYFSSEEILATDLEGREQHLVPDFADLDNHRSYHYQVLTKRGTVECRSICTQPLEKTFAPAAFQLGLLINLEKLENYLVTCDLFDSYGRDYPALRKRFSKKVLTNQEKNIIRQFCQDLLYISKEGAIRRGYSEEKYLSIIEI